jgi:hypothetical protein
LVNAAFPLVVFAVLGVAGLACTVAGIGRRHCFSAVSYIGLGWLTATRKITMLKTCSMATGTRWRTRVSPGSMSRLANRKQIRVVAFVMASCTHGVTVKDKILSRAGSKCESPHGE